MAELALPEKIELRSQKDEMQLNMAKSRKIAKRNLLMYLSIMGPGIVAALAGNDAGGVTTYSLAGAKYGYSLLWVLLLVTFSLAIIQEMAARMGVVTGKGLAALIREQFGLKLTIFCMFILLVANVSVTVAEFAGIAAALEIFGIIKYISVPIMAVVVWLLVLKGSYKSVEKVFFVFCLIFVSYVISAFLVRPPWGTVLKQTFIPSFKLEPGYIVFIITLIGTTVTPYMQFFIQANVVDKGLTIKDYAYVRLDVLTGVFVTNFVAFFIIVATAATLYKYGIPIQTAKDAALALKPMAGEYASQLFAFGLFNASTLAACILPLSTAYAVCEAFGWEAGIDKSFREAPIFIGLYTFTILVGALVTLIPKIPLILVIFVSQTINGFLLPIILIFMLLLINNRKIMGEYTNSRFFNIIAWAQTGAIIVLTLVLLFWPLF